MRHSRPSQNPRSAGMSQPIPPAPPKGPVAPRSRRNAWIVCGLLLVATIALYFYFKTRPKTDADLGAMPLPDQSSTEPAAGVVRAGGADPHLGKARGADAVQRVANANVPPAGPIGGP